MLQGGRAFTSRLRWVLPLYFAAMTPFVILYYQYRTEWLAATVMGGGLIFGLAMSRIGRAFRAKDSSD